MFTSFSYYSSSAYFNDNLPSASSKPTISIPIESPPSMQDAVDPSTVAAAVKIQSAFRAHLVRSLITRIREVEEAATVAEAQLRRQETVDAIRRRDDPRPRLRLAETLMKLLLRLDGVPGFYPEVRELRRAAARRIVALQELLDAVVAAPEPREDEAEGFPASLEEVFYGAIGRAWEEENGGGGRDGGAPARKFKLNCLERFLMGV